MEDYIDTTDLNSYISGYDEYIGADEEDYDNDYCEACGSHRCGICGEMTCFGCSCENEDYDGYVEDIFEDLEVQKWCEEQEKEKESV